MTAERVTNGAAPPNLSGSEVHDLSVLIAEDLPSHWSTHQPYQVKTWNWFTDHRHPAATALSRNGPYATRWMAIDEHTGTHVDAPCHFIPPPDSGLPDAGPAGAVTVEHIDLRRLMGPCTVIDVPDQAAGEPGISPLVEPAVVEQWEKVHGRLAAGDIVLFRTGWDRYYRRGADGSRYVYDVVVTERRPGWPAPSPGTVELLLERGVRCIGTDAPSMGPAHDGRPTHVVGLRAGAVYLECLANLAVLPVRGAWFCFLPLRIEGGTGAPGRAMALVPR